MSIHAAVRRTLSAATGRRDRAPEVQLGRWRKLPEFGADRTDYVDANGHVLGCVLALGGGLFYATLPGGYDPDGVQTCDKSIAKSHVEARVRAGDTPADVEDAAYEYWQVAADDAEDRVEHINAGYVTARVIAKEGGFVVYACGHEEFYGTRDEAMDLAELILLGNLE